jgi:serine phosphatase RsbU (regulator of sigma subunit)
LAHEGTTPMDADTPRILIVDDDRAVLQTYLRVLHEYSPLHADNGAEARRILSGTPVDIVLCDLEMPQMSGLDLMRWAKEHCPHPLWIVVSGQATFDAAAQAIKLGAFDFLCKPIQSAMQLVTVVANAVRHQALVRERSLLVGALTETNIQLAASHRELEKANDVLRDQQTMLDQDLGRAERIMRALLPHALQPLEQMQVNVAYRPSKTIGGDFYGAAMLDDRTLAVYVADAAGHGVSAALLAVLFNQRLSAFSAEMGPRSPATVLSDLNRALLQECRASGLFVTAVYALIDTKERTATLASAGHPPGILVRSSGIGQHLEKTGPALGLASDASYGELCISLAEGDRLLLYTDGLTGAMSERGSGLDAVMAAVAANSEDGVQTLDDLLARTDGAGDDRTLLLVTARRGASTFDADRAAQPRAAPTDCSLSVGAAGSNAWIVVRGRATWQDAAALRGACIEALDAGQDVIVDLGASTMLDSTVLGTLHELVARADTRPSTRAQSSVREKVILDGALLGALGERAVGPKPSLRIQNVGEELRELFLELAMTQVLSAIAPCAKPAPAGMTELRTNGGVATQDLILHAHELLAELSAGNAEQFQPVVDALRRETSASLIASIDGSSA